MAPDYTTHLASIAESLDAIAETFTSVDKTLTDILTTNQQMLEIPLASIDRSLSEMTQINDEILTRIKTKSLGIYMRQVEDSSQALTRAITVNALKRSDQISDVSAEIKKPTPIP